MPIDKNGMIRPKHKTITAHGATAVYLAVQQFFKAFPLKGSGTRNLSDADLFLTVLFMSGCKVVEITEKETDELAENVRSAHADAGSAPGDSIRIREEGDTSDAATVQEQEGRAEGSEQGAGGNPPVGDPPKLS